MSPHGFDRPLRTYGGRFVPEVLMAPIEELERAYLEARQDLRFKPNERTAPHYAAGPRRSIAPSGFPKRWARTPLAEARGPAAHRARTRSTTAWPGAIGAAHGQAPHHRRNRRRAARRGHRHGVRAARPGMRGLHGHRDMRRQRLNVFRMRLLGARWRRSKPAAAL